MQFQYEPWELTAHSLGELPEARSQEFDQAVATDSSLAAEINATREMISSLQTMLASDPESCLDSTRRAAVLGSMAVGVNNLIKADGNTLAVAGKPDLSGGFTLRRSIAALGALAASVMVIGSIIVVNMGGLQDASFKRISSADMERKYTYEERMQMQQGYSGGAPADVADAWGERYSNTTQRMGASSGPIPNAVASSPNANGQGTMPLPYRSGARSGGGSPDAQNLYSGGSPNGTDGMPAVGGTNLYFEWTGASASPAKAELERLDNGQIVPGVVQLEKRLKETQRGFLAGSGLDSLSTTLSEEKKEREVALTPRYRLPSVSFGIQPLSELESRDGFGRGVQFSDSDESARKLSALSAGGRGPGMSGDKYEPITDNPFYAVTNQPLSTFSIDVDTASYSKVRQFLMELNQLPRPDAVRIEELINYFQYSYAGPKDDKPFASSLAVAACPWQPKHKLVRIALQAKKVDADKRPLSNLVFLLDVSGSMNAPNRLPLVKKSIQMLARQLGENDQVAIVVYAGAAGLVLDTTSGKDQSAILTAIERLAAGGSTNGGEGIQLAYAKAREQFIPGGVNRVIFCTDGDFNVGVTGTDQLVRIMEENAKSKIFCTVLGFGMGNSNDAMLQKIADKGNGMHGFIDTELEANRMMVEQISGSLITVAKDVKIQVEFNPAKVGAYRLIGYENRVLAAQDFNNDKKDAGEIGAGHCVTALYEIVPVSSEVPAEARDVDASRYQKQLSLTPAADTGELLTVKLRYKEPEGDKSSLLEFPLVDRDASINDADRDFRWSAAIAQFGMLLRQSPYKGDSNWDSLLEMADEAAGRTPDTYREQALQMMRIAKGFSK